MLVVVVVMVDNVNASVTLSVGVPWQ